MTILWDITCSPHRCNGYRKFLTLSQVHHFRGVERWTRRRGGNTCSLQRGWEGEQGGEGNKEQGWEVNKDERGTRNKDESWTRRRGEQGTRMRGEQGWEGNKEQGWELNKEERGARNRDERWTRRRGGNKCITSEGLRGKQGRDYQSCTWLQGGASNPVAFGSEAGNLTKTVPGSNGKMLLNLSLLILQRVWEVNKRIMLAFTI